MYGEEPLYAEERSIGTQIARGVAWTAVGLGGFLAAAVFLASTTHTAGAPASRRLHKDAVALLGLEPVALDDAAQARAGD